MDVDCDPDLVSDRSVYFYFDFDVSEKIDQKNVCHPQKKTFRRENLKKKGWSRNSDLKASIKVLTKTSGSKS